MKNKFLLVTVVMTILLCCLSNCGVNTDTTSSKSTAAVVEYGDTIRVSCRTKCELEDTPTDWENKGESKFTVDTSTREFQLADYEFPEDKVTENVDQAVGKGVGDTFTLWFEGGNGNYGYEHTILEIKKK